MTTHWFCQDGLSCQQLTWLHHTDDTMEQLARKSPCLWHTCELELFQLKWGRGSIAWHGGPWVIIPPCQRTRIFPYVSAETYDFHVTTLAIFWSCTRTSFLLISTYPASFRRPNHMAPHGWLRERPYPHREGGHHGRSGCAMQEVATTIVPTWRYEARLTAL